MVPRAEWARPPSDVEATLVDGKAMTGGATGGATAATGTVGNPRAPQATDNAPCDDCGTSQDKVLEDGSNKRPIIPDAHVVMHHDGPSAYNATADYSGKGTPIEGVFDT